MDRTLIFVVVVLGTLSTSMATHHSWTPWYDRDNPSGSGDWESVSSIYSENPSTMCSDPVGIECQTTAGAEYGSTGEDVSCCATNGLVCKLEDNGNSCSDYKVRFLCPDSSASEPWTPWYDRDNPSGTGDYESVSSLYSENPDTMCAKPSGIECQTTSGVPYRSTGETVTCCAHQGAICKLDENSNSCSDYRVRFLCPDKWTPWYDRDNPSGTGDWESVSSIYSENPSTMCSNPTGIECQTTSGLSFRSTGETITCCAKDGLICKLDDNSNSCTDYKVRFLCPGLY